MKFPRLLTGLVLALTSATTAPAFDWEAARGNLGTVEVTDAKAAPLVAGGERPKWVQVPSLIDQAKATAYLPKNDHSRTVEYRVTKGGWVFFAAFFGNEGDLGGLKATRKDEKQLQADGWTWMSDEEIGGPLMAPANRTWKIFARQLPEGTADKFHVNKYTAPRFISFAEIPPASFAGLPKEAPAVTAAKDPLTKSILGDWIKYGGEKSGDTITLNADGTILISARNTKGSWKWVKKEEKRFEVTHVGGDTYALTLSDDEKRATGQFVRGDAKKIGTPVEYVRIGVSPSLPGSPSAARIPSSPPPVDPPAPPPVRGTAEPVGQDNAGPKPVAVADMIQPGKPPVNPAPGAIIFDGPAASGRRWSKGILLKSPPPADGMGSTWAFRLTHHPVVYPVQIIHPLGGGQVIIQLDTWKIGLATPTKWTEIGYKVVEDSALQRTAAFAEVFPLKLESEYHVASRLSTTGAYEMLINGKLVATAFVKNLPTSPLSLEIPEGTKFPLQSEKGGEMVFRGQDLPMQWSAGWAALFAGPVDRDAPNTCRAIQYFTNYVDPELGTPVAIPGSSKNAPPANPPVEATAPQPPVAAAKGNTPTVRMQPGATASPLLTIEQVKASTPATSSNPQAIFFDGPAASGRHGAKGLVFKGPAEITDNTWAFRYSIGKNARPLQIIHVFRDGQAIIHLNFNEIGTSSPAMWVESGYGVGNTNLLELTEAFASVFPLKADIDYQVISRLAGDGTYELLIDGKLIAFGRLTEGKALSLEIPEGKKFPGSGNGPLTFKGPGLPLRWERGWAALFVGPLDGRPHAARDVQFYTQYVDAGGVVLAPPPRAPLATAPPPATQAPVANATSKPATPAPLASIPKPPPPTVPTVKTPSLPPPVPAPAGVSLSASDLVKTHRSDLVFVTMQDGAGSGFIASYGNGTYLITNAHVAAGAKGAVFKSLDGTVVQAGAPAVAVGHDIFLMALKAGGTPLPVMIGVDEHAAINDEVVVLGNAEGAGVINTITGRIVGLGPNLVEVNAPFQPGNSGSPIIHLKSGKVIGVSTYAIIRKYDPATKEAVKEPVIRRFGYRLDSVKKWEPVNWQAFNAQAGEVENIEKLTEDLVGFLRDLGKDGRVDRGTHSNPAIKTRIDQWIEAKSKRLSARDSSMADQSFLGFLKVTCQSDITAAQQRLTYDYFRRQLDDQQKERTEIAKYLGKIIEDLRQER